MLLQVHEYSLVFISKQIYPTLREGQMDYLLIHVQKHFLRLLICLDVTFLCYRNTSVKADHSGDFYVCEAGMCEALVHELREDNAHLSSFFDCIYKVTFLKNVLFMKWMSSERAAMTVLPEMCGKIEEGSSLSSQLPACYANLGSFCLFVENYFVSEIKNCESELREFS